MCGGVGGCVCCTWGGLGGGGGGLELLETHVLTAWRLTIVWQYCYYCGSVWTAWCTYCSAYCNLLLY